MVSFAIFHTKQFRNSLQVCLAHAIYSEIILLDGHFPLNLLYDLMKKIFEECIKALLLKGSPYTVIGKASIYSRAG